MKKNLLMMACVIITIFSLVGCSSVPGKEQLQKDFVSKKIKKECKVTSFTVESKSEGEDDLYESIVKVVYNNGSVEYSEQYLLKYKKSDEWILDAIEDYKKDTWIKKSLHAPEIEEFKEKCKDTLENQEEFFDYDVFKENKDKSKIELNEGKAKFVFNVEKSFKTKSISGDIEFDVEFDCDTEQWEVKDYKYSENYKVDYRLLNTWRGKGKNNSLLYPDEKLFEIVIEKYDNKSGNTSAVLICDGEKYNVSGVIHEGFNENYSITLYNEKEEKSISGSLTFDGEMKVDIRTSVLYGDIDKIFTTSSEDAYDEVKLEMSNEN